MLTIGRVGVCLFWRITIPLSPLLRLLLLIGLVGATTSAFSNVLMEHREDELFIHFEKAGGVRCILKC